jgi:hypothetical protein
MADERSSRQVLVEIPIAAPPDAVWQALRRREQLRNWFGWDAETLADEIDYIFFDHCTVDEAARTIVGEPWEGASDGFEITERNGGTLLRVVRFGAPPLDAESAYDDIYEGWVTFVQQLRLLLDRHPGDTRRTLYLSGAAKPDVGEPSQALGLTGLRDRPEGAEYSVDAVTGDLLNGIVWHRTRYQLGLNVLEWGDGLLVVADKGRSDTRPNGGGTVLITTFDLDDGAFNDLEARWTRWWNERYTPAS